MRIGVSCYPTWGGSGVVASELAMAMANAGNEVHVISYALPMRLELTDPKLHFHEVVVPHYPLFEYPPYSLALATKIVEVARHHQLDLIHVHYAVPNAVSAVLAREILDPQPLKVVTTLHGTDVTLVGNDPNYLETTRFGIVQSDAVTAVSESLKATTQEQLGVSKHIQVVPNFIEPERFDLASKGAGARRWAEPGEKILVHVSNFRPVKRVLDVVEILLACTPRCRPGCCWLVTVLTGARSSGTAGSAICATPSPSSVIGPRSRRSWWVPTSFCCRRRPSLSVWRRWRRWPVRCR